MISCCDNMMVAFCQVKSKCLADNFICAWPRLLVREKNQPDDYEVLVWYWKNYNNAENCNQTPRWLTWYLFQWSGSASLSPVGSGVLAAEWNRKETSEMCLSNIFQSHKLKPHCVCSWMERKRPLHHSSWIELNLNFNLSLNCEFKTFAPFPLKIAATSTTCRSPAALKLPKYQFISICQFLHI